MMNVRLLDCDQLNHTILFTPYMEPVASGKVKDIYDAGDGRLRFHFSDRVSAYDVKFAQEIPRKGEVLCAFAEYWFESLGVPHHFVEKVSDTDIIVKKMEMIPLECVARGYLYGSLYDRYLAGKATLDLDDSRIAALLPRPIFDPTTKSEHDMPVDRSEAVRMNLVSESEYDRLERITLDIYKKMADTARSAGFIMADLKLEFGILDGEIVLGDSIGPDEHRLWPLDLYAPDKTQDTFDKQILRDWLSSEGHKARFERERAAGAAPTPPAIPNGIIEKMTRRYLEAYSRITSKSLGTHTDN